MNHSDNDLSSHLDMLVIQFGDRTVKGFAEKGQWPPVRAGEDGPTSISLTPLTSEDVETISLEGVKAIFRVKSFEGKGHDDLRFHDHLPAMECLWVRVTFHDGEVMEGLLDNTHHHVLDAGFLMSPIDPEGNNWMVYVFKNKLSNFEVLGLRPTPKNRSGAGAAQNELSPQSIA